MPAIRFAPIQNTRAFEAICDSIRGEIAAGRLKADDKLPSEREMAVQFGCGRNAVREALRSLEMAGVVRLRKGRVGGAYIRAADATRVTHAIRDLLDYGSITWEDLTEARIAILDAVVRLACLRAREGDFQVLERNIDETEELTNAGLLEERATRAIEFYRLLTLASRNTALVLLVTSMSDVFRGFIEIAARRAGRRPLAGLVSLRRQLVRSMRVRDVENAARRMRSQLIKVHELIAAQLDRRVPARSRAPRVDRPGKKVVP